MEEKVFFNGDKYLKIKNKDVGNGDVVYIKKIDGEKLFPPNLRKVSLIHGNEVVFEGNDIKNLNSLLLNSNTDEFETFRIASEVQSEKEQNHTKHEVDTISTNQAIDLTNAISATLSDTKWEIPIDNVAQDTSNTTITTGDVGVRSTRATSSKTLSVSQSELHSKILDEIHETYIKKNTDYGNSFSEQFNEYGLLSLIIRLDDKFRRLKQLHKNDAKVKDETIEDTLLDAANYAIMGVMEIREKNNTGNRS